MANPHRDKEFAGDYNLDSIKIISFDGKPVDIKSMVHELNIYESIHSTAITGSVVIADAQNLINKMPLQGTEKIVFKLSIPGTEMSSQGTIDATEETGHPFHIYKLGNKKQISEGLLLYTLYFCSRELFRNTRVRVSQAYNGPLHESAAKIFTDQEYLDSRKKLFVEPTRNIAKVVIPNLRPLDAIALLASKSLSGNANGAGYLFYETTKGYHFRSFENLYTKNSKTPRDIVARFDYMVRKSRDANTEEKGKYIQDLEAVEKYEFISNFDSAASQAMGTYANSVITHNIYDKSYAIAKFHYHNEYNDFSHVEDSGSDDHRKFSISPSPVDYDEKTVSDYHDSNVSLVGSTAFLHNEDKGIYGIDPKLDGKTNSIQLSQNTAIANSVMVKLTVHGQSYLEAGDVIFFALRSVESGKGVFSTGTTLDEQHSGRYIITSIRHRVVDTDYKMVLICCKESVYTGWGAGTYTGTASKSKGEVLDLYKMDA
jgi:hypothetical protein|tara:strand:- start:105 stop:1559 length:1455 start_codon:yes stop_codon:yes gene_type:complete